MGIVLSLSGKVAIVTGASRQNGIGTAICHALAEAGADIFFTYWTSYDHLAGFAVDDGEPRKLQEAIRQKGVRCESLELDLSKEEAVPALLDAVESSLGEADILVNNACYSASMPYTQLTAGELYRHYLINVQAPLLLSVEFAKRFSKQTGGRIIQMTSGQGLGAMPNELAYAATKAALAEATPTLAAEAAPRGITVNCINPGPTDTGWMTNEVRQNLLARFPFGRTGTPRDAARVVRFLASDEASWITGQTIHSEGGFIR